MIKPFLCYNMTFRGSCPKIDPFISRPSSAGSPCIPWATEREKHRLLRCCSALDPLNQIIPHCNSTVCVKHQSEIGASAHPGHVGAEYRVHKGVPHGVIFGCPGWWLPWRASDPGRDCESEVLRSSDSWLEIMDMAGVHPKMPGKWCVSFNGCSVPQIWLILINNRFWPVTIEHVTTGLFCLGHLQNLSEC